MKEILQSIKRIIADEDDDEVQVAPAEPVSDVLELTDLVEEEEPLKESPMDGLELVAKPASEQSVEDAIDSIISNEVAEVSATALQTLKEKAEEPPKPRPQVESPSFRSGSTVEDLVLEALRPMLKEWLDANLPAMVEDLVAREIRRISR